MRSGEASFKSYTEIESYVVLNTTSQYITVYEQFWSGMTKYLRTIGFTCKDGFCSATGNCDKYDDKMQDLEIQFDKVKFTLTPASYSYTKSGTCHIAVTSQPQNSAYIVLGNPFLIAFTTTLRMSDNKAEFRLNPRAPPGVKFATI